MSLLRRKPTKMSWLRCPSHSSRGMKMPVGMECLLPQFLPRTTLRWIKVEGTLGKSHFSFTHLFQTFVYSVYISTAEVHILNPFCFCCSSIWSFLLTMLDCF